MRPNDLEAIRAVQMALAETIVPELQTPFARDTAQTLSMLLESVAAGWDDGAEELARDNEALADLLASARDSIDKLATGQDAFATVSGDIDTVLAEEDPEPISMPTLAARNLRLNEVLEVAVEMLESTVGEDQYDAMSALRTEIYRHLRDVAGRGWSFWDVASFREYMAAHRAGK